MTDDMEIQQRQRHWDELARQLGLEPAGDPITAPSMPSQAGMPSASRASNVDIRSSTEKFQSENRHERAEELCVPAEASPDLSYSRVREQSNDHGAEATGDKPEHSSPPKRNRGRKSRKKSQTAELESRQSASSDASVGEQEAARDELEKSSSRGSKIRGRRGRTKTSKGGPAKGTTDRNETADSSSFVHPDDDSDEADNLSDWNVPSWTELIGSLYRPDR